MNPIPEIEELLVSLLGIGRRTLDFLLQKNDDESYTEEPFEMQFVQAKNYGPARKQPITAIVIHTMEAPEGERTAENTAGWFATQPAEGSPYPENYDQKYRPTDGKFHGSSAHYNVGAANIVQSVRESDEAWHAGPANPFSIGIEHVGYARQSAAEWQDEFSQKELKLSAQLAAEICKMYNIPVVRLKPEDLAGGKRAGFTGHVDVTNGMQGGRGHQDPGPFFPWDQYLSLVNGYLTAKKAAVKPSSGTSGTDLGGVAMIGLGLGLATYFLRR